MKQKAGENPNLQLSATSVSGNLEPRDASSCFKEQKYNYLP